MRFRYNIGQLVGYRRANSNEICAIMQITDRSFIASNGDELPDYYYTGFLTYVYRGQNGKFNFAKNTSGLLPSRGSAVARESQLVSLSDLDKNVFDIGAIKMMPRRKGRTII